MAPALGAASDRARRADEHHAPYERPAKNMALRLGQRPPEEDARRAAHGGQCEDARQLRAFNKKTPAKTGISRGLAISLQNFSRTFVFMTI